MDDYVFLSESVATATPISTSGTAQPSFLRDVGNELLNIGGALVLGRARQAVDYEFQTHGFNPDAVDVRTSRAQNATTVAAVPSAAAVPVWAWVVGAAALVVVLFLILRR